jgi:hypothetical protein
MYWISSLLTLSSKDQNVFCIVNCKEDYDHLKLACKPILLKINTLYEKARIEVEGKHSDLDILIGGDMKFLQLVLGLGGSLCNYSGTVHGIGSIKTTRGQTTCYCPRKMLFPRSQITRPPTQLWELLYTYHIIKQCTEKETISLSNFLLTFKLNYLSP